MWQTPNMVPFIENNEVKVNNVVNSIMALAKFANWIAAVGNKILPRFDVAALFTVYEFIYKLFTSSSLTT